MSLMVFLKIFSDLCIFLSAAGFFALRLGANSTSLLLLAPACALLFTFSYWLRKRGILRYAPFILAPALFLLPGLGPWGMVLAALSLLYVIYLIWKKRYEPQWDEQVSIFSWYWKIILPLFLFFCILHYDSALAVVLPAGLGGVLGCILLNRSLRHGPEVYSSFRFQLVNGGLLIFIVLAALLLGSPQVLSAVSKGLGWFYHTLIQPLLLGFVSLFMGLLKLLKRIFSFIRFTPADPEKPSSALEGPPAEVEPSEPISPEPIFDSRALLALVVLAAIILLILLLRKLGRGMGRRKAAAQKEGVIRSSIAPEEEQKEKPPRGPVRKIRQIYRKYLQLYGESGISLASSDTSRDVYQKGLERFDRQAGEKLRGIYLEARYRGSADEEDAEEAKKLYRKMASE